MDEDVKALAGAVDGMRMLKDGTMAVTLHFEPKDRELVMKMMGEPGASIACVRLVDGHAAAKPAAGSFRDLGPICREAIELCGSEQFQRYVAGIKRAGVSVSDAVCKQYICLACNVESRKELDSAEGARRLFIEHVRKPFHRWLTQA